MTKKQSIETGCRKASGEDLDAILNLEQDCFNYEGERFNRRQILYLLKSRHAIVYVLAEDGKVLGWAIGTFRKAKTRISGRLYGLAIDPRHHGRKFGGLLTGKIIEGLRHRGAERIFLEVREDNAGAIHLYQKFGFKEICKLPDYYEPGVHGIRMLLIFSPGQRVQTDVSSRDSG